MIEIFAGNLVRGVGRHFSFYLKDMRCMSEEWGQ